MVKPPNHYDFMTSCCALCFRHPFIRKYIRSHGNIGDCDYCETSHVKVIRPQLLRELLRPLVSLFEPVERDVHYDPHGVCDVLDFEPLGYLLDEKWEIFRVDFDGEIRDRLMDDIWIRRGRECDGVYDDPPSGPWASLDDRMGDPTPEQTWRWFSEAVKAGSWEDINSDESGELVHPDKWVDYSIRHRRAVRIITQKTVLYRGRPDHPLSVSLGSPPLPWPPDEMHAPPANLAKRGRVNRAGERVFYAAYEVNTALREAGREAGALVSVRQVAAVRRLRLADLTKFHGVTMPFGVENLAAIERHSRLLQQLNLELSRRVEEHEADIDYLPTQVLGNAIRDAGYDGICFRSSRNTGGTNIVVFDPAKMSVLPQSRIAHVLPVPEDFYSATENLLTSNA